MTLAKRISLTPAYVIIALILCASAMPQHWIVRHILYGINAVFAAVWTVYALVNHRRLTA